MNLKNGIKFIPKNLPFFGSCVLATMPLHSRKVQLLIFVIWLIICLLDSYIHRLNEKKSVFKIFIVLPITFYFLLISSILYSQDINLALSEAERRLSLLVVPIILYFSRSKFTEQQRNVIIFTFVSSCILLSLYMLTQINISTIMERVELIGMVNAVTEVRNSFTVASGLHPTYLSVYFLFSCLLISIFILKNNFSIKWKITFSLIYLYLLLFSTYFAARMPLIAFFVVQFLILIFDPRTKPKLKIFVIACLMILSILGFFFVPSLQHRALEIVETEWKPPIGEHHNSTNLRVGITICSFEILKGNWLVGVGLGDVQHELNKCLHLFPTEEYKRFNYNPHNEYLTVWLSSGFVPFILFLTFLGAVLYTSLKQKDVFLASLVIFLSLVMLTENFLARQAGIIFFMFFYFVFIKGWQNYHSSHGRKS